MNLLKRKFWSPDEVDDLRNIYSFFDGEYLVKYFNRSLESIEHRAHRLGLTKRQLWLPSEDAILNAIYHDSTKIQLSEKLNRTWKAIVSRAKALGLHSRRQRRLSNLKILLEDNPITLYWIGFLLADGHFDNNISKKGNYSLSLDLGIKDKAHLQKFATLIDSSIKLKRYTVRVRAHDRDCVIKLMQKYTIKNNKTKKPPEISSLTLSNDLSMALLIGFMDGDGHIVKNGTAMIRIFSTWLPILIFWRNILISNFGCITRSIPKINRAGYASWFLNSRILRFMKTEANRMQLPILERKWQRVTS